MENRFEIARPIGAVAQKLIAELLRKQREQGDDHEGQEQETDADHAATGYDGGSLSFAGWAEEGEDNPRPKGFVVMRPPWNGLRDGPVHATA